MAKNNDKRATFLYEAKDVLSGTAFPLMLQLILSVTFIGMSLSLAEDLALAIVLLCIGELLLGVAYFIFGRQSGITSVRRLVINAKKREIGTSDKQALLYTGEYSAYKGFLMGFLSCVPYVIFQIIQCAVPNTFCEFVLQYVFGWAAIPLSLGNGDVTPWLNLVFIIYPIAVHGAAYIICAHREWNKQQKMAEIQRAPADIKEDK